MVAIFLDKAGTGFFLDPTRPVSISIMIFSFSDTRFLLSFNLFSSAFNKFNLLVMFATTFFSLSPNKLEEAAACVCKMSFGLGVF